MAEAHPPAPKGSKGAPAPKGFAAKINHEVGVGPLKLPLWGWGAVAIGAWWFWFHVIQPYNAQKDAQAAPTGGSNLGAGSGGGGGGGQTGKATPPHHHGKHKHRHRGGHNQHRHPDKRPAVKGGAFQPSTFNPRHSGAGVGRTDHHRLPPNSTAGPRHGGGNR